MKNDSLYDPPVRPDAADSCGHSACFSSSLTCEVSASVDMNPDK